MPARPAAHNRIASASLGRPDRSGHRVDLPELVRPDPRARPGRAGGRRFDSVEVRAYTTRPRGPIPGDGATHDRPGPVRTGFPEENQR